MPAKMGGEEKGDSGLELHYPVDQKRAFSRPFLGDDTQQVIV